MAVHNLNIDPIVPSDVFGWEANTDVGYTRESYTITVPANTTVAVGSVLILDEVAKTATLATATTAVADDAVLGVFVGRDLPYNRATAQDFERLTMTETGVGVAIIRGDGRGTLYKKYLDFSGTKFYSLTAVQQATIKAKFTLENRFKVLDQV